MRGARYGDVVKITKERERGPRGVKGRGFTVTSVEHSIAHVRLDATGKVIRVLLDDCTVV
jgi:hypothetical protein